MVSSWKLDSSSTNTSRRAPASVLRFRAARRAPAGRCCRRRRCCSPAARHIAPVISVTVLLPLVPVIASTLALHARAAPARTARCRRPPARRGCAACATAGSRDRHAGADRDQVDAARKLSRRNAPRASRGTSRQLARRAAQRARRRLRACRRRARRAPRRAAASAPSTGRVIIRARAPVRVSFRASSASAHSRQSSSQRSFSVDSPNSTSIIVMIQNRTTTWFSFQPFNS